MRIISIVCALLALALLVTSAIMPDAGYVLLTWGKTAIETSVVTAGLLSLLLLWLLALLMSFKA